MYNLPSCGSLLICCILFYSGTDLLSRYSDLFIQIAANVPGYCETPVLCGVDSISRSTVISRAQTWVNAGVPYSQTRYKDSYRTDCSGYVSMAWELARNYNTNTLLGITTPISKNDLAAGDILLKSGEHVTIFSSWVDTTKSKYWGYEESSTRGAVYRQIPYPYFYRKNQFFPRRYTGIQ